ncbi:sigma factor-like helix-turn-helix DNA-binding protein [Acetomicrobium sp. UBA5826]|uniref:sigma factor-like helix-turn-helix DNA-binding protein n=1 Tax=Acetomicrobium sp. UBA5826 TaxID=1946039 RepID=UPI002579910F|nr:sigma factor-like helix-turn-helix DNA-binding protein [Acetomicrobium sp. UBA5826]
MADKCEDFLKSRIEMSLLYDIYGGLLTDKQRKAFELHEMSDWSLSEVADAIEVSRQGVFELLQRARKRLVEIEEVVGFKRTLVALEEYKKNLEKLLDQHEKELSEEFKSKMSELLSELRKIGDQDV